MVVRLRSIYFYHHPKQSQSNPSISRTKKTLILLEYQSRGHNIVNNTELIEIVTSCFIILTQSVVCVYKGTIFIYRMWSVYKNSLWLPTHVVCVQKCIMLLLTWCDLYRKVLGLLYLQSVVCVQKGTVFQQQSEEVTAASRIRTIITQHLGKQNNLYIYCICFSDVWPNQARL